MALSSRRVPLALLCLALFASGAMLLVLTRNLTYFQDSWQFLINRREFSPESLLKPHNEHIVLLPVAFQILFLNVFGMVSTLPNQLLLTGLHLTSGVLLFVWARRRVGEWAALMAAALLLFIGPAWQDLLWTFQVGFVGSVAAGLALLLCLDRDDRRGDIGATVFGVVSIAFLSLGVTFVAAAAVDVFMKRGRRGLGRAYVVAVPALLFLAWYAGWGKDAESNLALRNVTEAPRFVVEGLSASVESLLGLNTAAIGEAATLTWGPVLLVAILALVVLSQVRRPGFSPGFWPVAFATAVSWFLTAMNYIAGREPTSGRYMYAGGVFVLLMAAELLRGVRLGRTTLAICGVVTLGAISSNLHFFHDGAKYLDNQTELTRADLAAIEISRETVDPGFELSPEVAGTPSLVDVFAGDYLDAEREFGSPAYSTQDLATAPEGGRIQADVILSKALPISLLERPGAAFAPGASRGSCVSLGDSAARPSVRLAPGATRIEVAPGPRAKLSLRRFADAVYPVHTKGAAGDSVTVLRIPADSASQPWYLRTDATQPVRVCR